MLKALIILFFVAGCTAIKAPTDFVYKEIPTRDFTLASWQKITEPSGTYKIYIEGDGYAFNAHGRATQDPTPKGILMRELAFGDDSPNVVYLARPCQYIKSPICSKLHWTTARFAPEVINAEYAAVKQIVGDNPVILIGFSGGAQVAGLIASAKPGLNVKKVITIAGNLDHLAWKSYHKQFARIPQIHYVGSNDEVVPPLLVRDFVGKDTRVFEVRGATHNSGWEEINSQILNEK